MQSLLLVSHGELSKGMKNTVEMFFGDNIKQFETLSLNPEDNPDEFDVTLSNIIRELDKGDGIVIFCDLLFGTPFNSLLRINYENSFVITGMNLPMILEFLGKREQEFINENELINIGLEGIVSMKKILAEMEQS